MSTLQSEVFPPEVILENALQYSVQNRAALNGVFLRSAQLEWDSVPRGDARSFYVQLASILMNPERAALLAHALADAHRKKPARWKSSLEERLLQRAVQCFRTLSPVVRQRIENSETLFSRPKGSQISADQVGSVVRAVADEGWPELWQAWQIIRSSSRTAGDDATPIDTCSDDPAPALPDEDGPLPDWAESCARLAELAEKAGRGIPDPDLVADLHALVDELGRIAEAADDGLVEEVLAVLDAVAGTRPDGEASRLAYALRTAGAVVPSERSAVESRLGTLSAALSERDRAVAHLEGLATLVDEAIRDRQFARVAELGKQAAEAEEAVDGANARIDAAVREIGVKLGFDGGASVDEREGPGSDTPIEEPTPVGSDDDDLLEPAPARSEPTGRSSEGEEAAAPGSKRAGMTSDAPDAGRDSGASLGFNELVVGGRDATDPSVKDAASAPVDAERPAPGPASRVDGEKDEAANGSRESAPESEPAPKPEPEDDQREGGGLPKDKAAVAHRGESLSGLLALACRGEAPDPGIIELICARLVMDGRPGLAHHLACAAGAELGWPALEQFGRRVKIAVLANHLRKATGSSAVELRDNLAVLDEAPEGLSTTHQFRFGLLAFAGSLRPSLVAPDTTNAGEVLGRVQFGRELQYVSQLRDVVREVRFLGVAGNPAFFRMAKGHGQWIHDVEALSNDASEWLEATRRKNLPFAAATRVLDRWLKSDGRLGRLLQLVIKEEPSERVRKELLDLLEKIESRSEMDKYINAVDQENRSQKARIGRIEGRARRDLNALAGPVATFGRQWLALLESKPTEGEHGGADAVRQLSERLKTLVPQALRELEEQRVAESGDPVTVACISLAMASIDALESAMEELDRPLSAKHVLHGELLRLPDPPSGEDVWAFETAPALRELLELVPPGELDDRSLLESLARRNRHDASARLVRMIEDREGDVSLVDELNKIRDRMVRTARTDLRERRDALSAEVERYVREGHVLEKIRLQCVSALENLHIDDELDLSRAQASLDELEGLLRDSRSAGIERARAQLADSGIESTRPEDHERILALLDHGDVLTANEYLGFFERGDEIPAPPKGRDALGRFLGRAADLEEFIEKYPYSKEFRSQVEERTSPYPMDMAEVSEAQARTAGELLKTWFGRFLSGRTSRNKDELGRAVAGILELIGFPNPKARIDSAKMHGDAVEMLIETDRIEDADLCPLPVFGSSARGRYRVVCLFGASLPQTILNRAEASGSTVPAIVLVASSLSLPQRNDLARLCAGRTSPPVVLDSVLLSFLATEPGARLPAFIECAAAYSVNNPYVTSSSNVAVEMFFGRRREMDALLDPLDSNLVYGGRQLGKTALLRELERRHHKPDQGIIVKWVDLKPRGVGDSHPVGTIWKVLAQTLADYGVADHRISNAGTLARAVIDWLDEDVSRRILLLLDEADLFLTQDGEDANHQNLSQLKDLMDRTERRFKVVFAGLHNVQRGARDVNTPIAHLGQPQCVGPLLDNGEVREALSLVVRPFEALGYRFAPDAASRILSHTNYYPSLIQIFCRHLLDHLTETVRSKATSGPPYIITVEDVDEAFRSKSIRDGIVEKFNVTLELDNRYKVIALRIAFEALARRERGEAGDEGCDIGWIYSEATQLWPAGLGSESLDSMRTLLDEMVGLGILRKVDAPRARYAMRSPNIIGMLGSAEDIEDSLWDACYADKVVQAYNAEHFRRFAADNYWLRSPITGQQESEIFSGESGVCLVFGHALSCLEDVPSFLREAREHNPEPDKVHLSMLDLHAEPGRFRDDVAQCVAEAHERGLGGVQILVAPLETPWSEAWLSECSRVLADSAKRKKLRTRVVFLGDAHAAWRCLAAPDGFDLRSEPQSIIIKRWNDSAIVRWMKDASFGPINNSSERARFLAATGGWPLALKELGHAISKNDADWLPRLEEFEKRDDWLPASIDLPEAARPVLSEMAELGGAISLDDLCELLDADERDRVAAILEWSVLMGLARHTEREGYELDKIVARTLANG